jgi:hypothetical protein
VPPPAQRLRNNPPARPATYLDREELSEPSLAAESGGSGSTRSTRGVARGNGRDSGRDSGRDNSLRTSHKLNSMYPTTVNPNSGVELPARRE